ncbi:acetyltransferase [Erwinia amylovora]|uniref:acetyltransferase n=1 Tax=Erwinia amylovora TaxID=552 RepID=UPI001F037ED3|nr:acetyltransferase [Erwinia amylovora]
MTIKRVAMNESHLDDAFALTQQLQWPHRRTDWQQMLLLGEGLVALENGTPVGTRLCWRWGRNYATLGLLRRCALPGTRYRQAAAACHARAFWRSARRFTCHGSRCMKAGFCLQWPCCAAPKPHTGSGEPYSVRSSATAGDMALLIALDRQALGQAQAPLTGQLLASAVRVLLLEEDGRVVGFAGLRCFGHGYSIGPVVAAQAQLLVSEQLGPVAQFVRIDRPVQAGLTSWLDRLDMVQVDAPITMYKAKPWQPEAGGMQTLGLQSQALA